MTIRRKRPESSAQLPLLKLQLLSRSKPFRKDDFAVFTRREVHRFCALLQVISHLLTHVDPDSFRIFTDGVSRHSIILCLRLSTYDNSNLPQNHTFFYFVMIASSYVKKQHSTKSVPASGIMYYAVSFFSSWCIPSPLRSKCARTFYAEHGHVSS